MAEILFCINWPKKSDFHPDFGFNLILKNGLSVWHGLNQANLACKSRNNPIIWWNQGLSSVKSAAESYCLVFNSLIFRSNIWNAVKCIGKISVWDCLEYIKVGKDAIFCLEKGLFSDWKALCKHPTDYWNLMNMLGMPLKELSKPPLKWLKMIRNHWVSNLTKMT